MPILPNNPKRFNSNSEDNMCSHHTFDFSKGGMVVHFNISIPPSKFVLQNIKK